MKNKSTTLLILAGIGLLTLAVLLKLPLWDGQATAPSPHAVKRDEAETTSKPNGRKPNAKLVLPPPPDAEEFKRMIETEAVFYGKVVDQDGNAVPNAEVHFKRRAISQDEVSTLIPIWQTTTNSAGCFTIRQPQAPNLDIGVTCPPGYYSTEESTSRYFDFYQYPDSFLALLPERTRLLNLAHVADPNNPVIFKLKRMGHTEPMIYREKSAVVKSEQDFLIGTNPSHALRLKYWLDPNSKRIESPHGSVMYDWGFELSIAGGGLLLRKDTKSTEASSFIAPVAGYTAKITNGYNVNMDFTENTPFVKREYFARFSDGTHARIVIDLDARPKRPWVNLDSWFNPAPGSRATEFDPSKQIEQKP